MGIYGNYINENVEALDENLIDDVKQKIADLNALKEEWKKTAGTFVKHKWIYRYINEEQKARLNKYYEMLTKDDTTYQEYKKAFTYISQFMGLPKDKIIIENLVFEKDKKDKDQDVVAVKYSKGLAKVQIPPNVHLIHVSPADNIQNLEPSFRSKVKGKYMYPTKRCFFTVAKEIKPTHAGLEKTKTTRYSTKDNYTTAYIDPTYADFADGSVYIETDKPIPVEKYEKKMLNIFKKKENKEG